MSYRFLKKNKGSDTDPIYEYGVDLYSVEKTEFVLQHLDWYGWTSNSLQDLIDKTISLEGDDFFDYIVEGSELRISIDNEYVLFFDWRTDGVDEDLRWTTEKFLSFIENFRQFIQNNPM